MRFSLFCFPGDLDAPAAAYGSLARLAAFADAHDFEAVWLPERHFHAFGGLCPNPVVAAAWLAPQTRRIALRAGSVLLPLHHPVRLAEEWALVDNLSGGRIGIAAGMGWHADDFVLNPDAFPRRADSARETLDAVRRLWRGEALAWRGGHGDMTPIVTYPRPVQPELPVWMTCTGARDTFLLAAAAGYGVLTYTASQTIEELGETLDAYRRAFRPGARQTPHAAVMVHTYVGRDAADVEACAIAPYRRYLMSSVALFRRQVRDEGRAIETLSAAELESLVRHSGERLRRTRSLVGAPDECAAVLARLRQIGVDEVACLVDFGVAPDAMLRGLERLVALASTQSLVS